MTKKDFECQVHTWMMKKAKNGVYKGEKRKGVGGSLKNVRRNLLLHSTLYTRILNFFTLKSNILAQDQTSFLSCTL